MVMLSQPGLHDEILPYEVQCRIWNIVLVLLGQSGALVEVLVFVKADLRLARNRC